MSLALVNVFLQHLDHFGVVVSFSGFVGNPIVSIETMLMFTVVEHPIEVAAITPL